MNARSLTLAALLALSATAAQASYSYTGTAVTESFDGINPAGTTTSATTGTQFAIAGTGFDGAKIAGTGTNALPFLVDDGSSNTGALYSYGATGATDRALGTLASGTNVPGFGAVITNNSGSALTSFTLAFNTEQYRNSTSVQNIIAFAYGLSGSAATAANYLSNSSLTADTRFDLNGAVPVVGTQGPVLIVTPVSATINMMVAAGQSIYLRWQDNNDAGNDAGIGIDNFRFTATAAAGGGGTGGGGGTPGAVPEPASCLLMGMGLVGGLLVARRRSAR